jgi:hypothetical protein
MAAGFLVIQPGIVAALRDTVLRDTVRAGYSYLEVIA